MMEDISPLNVVLRIAIAAICGGVLGWEREASDKPAGLRTNMLVAIGAATATIAAMDLFVGLARDSNDRISSDPIRIISGVIGGLGFLGAGAILQSKGRIQGMTTAATIWVVGGIGIACGLGNYVLSVSAVAISFVVLYAIGKFEKSQVAPESLQKKSQDERPENP